MEIQIEMLCGNLKDKIAFGGDHTQPFTLIKGARINSEGVIFLFSHYF